MLKNLSWHFRKENSMITLKEAINRVCPVFKVKWQFFTKDPSDRVQQMRNTLYDMCVSSGNKAVTMSGVDLAILEYTSKANSESVNSDTLVLREGLTSDTPVSLDDPETALTVSHWWGLEPPQLAVDGCQALINVPHWNNEFIRGVAEEFRDSMKTTDAEKFIPGRCMDELDRQGLNEWHIFGTTIENAGRVHPDSRGSCMPYNKACRAIATGVNRKTTRLGRHVLQAHLADQGLTKAVRAEALSDPVKWLQRMAKNGKKPGSAMIMLSDIYSYHLVETSGFTPFRIWKDMSGSGYTIQLWLQRFREVFKRAVTNSSKFKAAHESFSEAMKEISWGQGKWRLLATVPTSTLTDVAKAAFMVCMYTGRKYAIMEGLTDEDRFHDPTEAARYILPRVLEDTYFANQSNEEVYPVLLELCEDLAKLFVKCFRKSGMFTDYWTKEWDKVKPKEVDKVQPYFTGYWLDYPGGGKILAPHLGMHKKKHVEREASWFDGSSTATVNVPKFNSSAAVLITLVCRMFDCAILFEGICRANGKIESSMHDAIAVHPNNEPSAQVACTTGANHIFSTDWMNTGKPPVTLPDWAKMFRS